MGAVVIKSNLIEDLNLDPEFTPGLTDTKRLVHITFCISRYNFYVTV